MSKMRWQVALDVLSAYHTNEQIADMAGASAGSVSGWRNGRHDPGGVRKRKLVAEAEHHYPKEMKRMEVETDAQ